MTDDMSAVLASLAKSSEGTVLGLAALAETLQKMETRFAKAEDEETEEEERKRREEEEREGEVQKASLVKEIAGLVLKEVTAGLQELGAKKTVDVSGKTKWPMSANTPGEDQEKQVDPRTAKGSEEAQKVIQAMRKQEEEPHVLGCKCPECLEKAAPVEEEPAPEPEAVEYPEKTEDMEKYPEEIKMLAKELKALRKENADLKASLPGLIEKEADSRLTKLGFTKEVKTSPSLKSLGTDGVPVIKSDAKPEDNIDELAKLPWNVLWDLKLRKAAGDTDGIPKELA